MDIVEDFTCESKFLQFSFLVSSFFSIFQFIFHFPSFSFMFFHVLSCSFMFFHFLFLFFFFSFSFSFSFSLLGAPNLIVFGPQFRYDFS